MLYREVEFRHWLCRLGWHAWLVVGVWSDYTFEACRRCSRTRAKPLR